MKKLKFEDKNTHVLFQQVAHPYVAIPVSACQPSQSHLFESRSLSVLKSHFCRPLVTASRRHCLRPVSSSLLADECFHFTLCFFLLIALEAMPFGLKVFLSWEPNSCRTYLTMQLSLLYPVHTRRPPRPGLGHAPRANPCPRHDGIFLAYLFKTFRIRHGSQHALAEETVTKHSRNLHERRTGVSQSEPEDARARHFCVMDRSRRK